MSPPVVARSVAHPPPFALAHCTNSTSLVNGLAAGLFKLRTQRMQLAPGAGADPPPPVRPGLHWFTLYVALDVSCIVSVPLFPGAQVRVTSVRPPSAAA